MANLRIFYPDIPAAAASVTTNASFLETAPLSNAKDGARANGAASASSDVLLNYDLGSGYTGAANHCVIARADKITLNGQFRVQGSSASRFQPTITANPVLWFDSNRSVTTVSGAVSSWSNLITATNDATQATAGNRPTLSTFSGGTNGNRKITYDGTADYLTTAYAVNPTGGFWCSCVIRPTAFTSLRTIMDGHSSGAARFLCRLRTDGTIAVFMFAGGGNEIQRSTTFALSLNTVYVLTVTYDGTTNPTGIKIYVNGIQRDVNSGTLGTYTVLGAGAALQIGGPFSSQYFAGDINELAFFTGTPAAGAREAVEAYLATKWQTAPVVNVSALGGETKVGPRINDYVAAFSTTSAFRQWWLEFYQTTAFSPSKLFLGQAFNPAVDCEYRSSLDAPGASDFTADSGERTADRAFTPRYSFELSWSGLTDSEINTFAERIWKRRQKSTFFLYASGQPQVLLQKTLFHVRLISAEWRRVGKVNYNVLTATFEEVV